MNIPTRKKDDELMMEHYNSNDKAYNRTPEEQKEIDDKIAGFKKRTEVYHEKNPYADPLRKYRLKSRPEGEEDKSVKTLLSNQKGNMLVWNSTEPKLWTAVSIESGEPKGYFADVTDIGKGKYVASVFDCINIARDEARASAEEYDEEADTAQHLKDFIEDYKAESYKKEEEQEKKTRIQNFLISRAKRAIGKAYGSVTGATRRVASANVKSSREALADAEKAEKKS